LISRTLKLFNKILEEVELSDYLDDENTLIMMKSGLDFLTYTSEVGNNDKKLIELMSKQLERDTIITDIFNMFTKIISNCNKRFKSIYKHKDLKTILFYFLIDSNHNFEKKEISESLTNLTRVCQNISPEEFTCNKMPGEVFIEIMHADFLPIVLTKIYNDPSNIDFSKTKNKSKKYEEIKNLKIIKCTHFFNLFGSLIKVNGDLEVALAEDILTSLLEEFKSMKRIELNEETEDKRLASLINLISIVFNNCPDAKSKLVNEELFDFVLNH